MNDKPLRTAPQEAFLQTIATTRGGALLEALTDAQQECVIMAKTKKVKTKLVLTLEYEPDNDDFKITSSIEKKIPNKKSMTEYVYTDEAGLVFRNDPRQQTMFEARIINNEEAA